MLCLCEIQLKVVSCLLQNFLFFNLHVLTIQSSLVDGGRADESSQKLALGGIGMVDVPKTGLLQLFVWMRTPLQRSAWSMRRNWRVLQLLLGGEPCVGM